MGVHGRGPPGRRGFDDELAAAAQRADEFLFFRLLLHQGVLALGDQLKRLAVNFGGGFGFGSGFVHPSFIDGSTSGFGLAAGEAGSEKTGESPLFFLCLARHVFAPPLRPPAP